MYRAAMVDIETLGIGPGSIIGSVAVVAFNPEGGSLGPHLSIQLDMEEQEELGLRVSVSTFVWWLDQSEEARAEMRSSDRASVGETLQGMARFFEENLEPGATIWAKSPRFDLAMIERLCEYVKMDRFWGFAAEDDVRTIVRVAGIEPPRVAGAHTALGDAIAQARLVQDCFAALGKGIGSVEE